MNQAKKLEKMMTAAGFAARAVYGGNKHNEEIFEQYGEKKIQSLLSCQLISEGWDSPQTEVVVMARPTLSKVLYTHANTPAKNASMSSTSSTITRGSSRRCASTQ